MKLQRTTFSPRSLWAGQACLALASLTAHAADISVTPPPGGGFVVKGTSTPESMRVQGSGDVLVPGLANTPTTNTSVLCFDGPTGRLGQCAPGAITGATGAPGARGPTGATGPTGAPGPAGATGTAGATGATGPAGATGATGPAGTPGTQGVPGATGATGATGLQGPAGATGATGPQGPAGSALTVTVRTANAPGTADSCSVTSCCSAGEKVIGGGYEGASGASGADADGVYVAGSFPVVPGGTCGANQGWSVRLLNSYRVPALSTACVSYAICAQ